MGGQSSTSITTSVQNELAGYGTAASNVTEVKSRKEAAKLLGISEGSLSWRLSQGKKLLAKKLAQRKGELSLAVLTAALAKTATASVHPSLLTATAAAARHVAAGGSLTGVVSAQVALLIEGVVKAMFMSKLKVFGAVVLALTLGAGGIGVGIHAGAAEPKKAADGPARMAMNEVEALRADVDALRRLVMVTRERVLALESEVKTLKEAANANSQAHGMGAGIIGMQGAGFIGQQSGGQSGLAGVSADNKLALELQNIEAQINSADAAIRAAAARAHDPNLTEKDRRQARSSTWIRNGAPSSFIERRGRSRPSR